MTSKKSTEANLQLAEAFFFQPHPFSDLTLLVQDKELYVDKSVLTVASRVFQNYFRDQTVDSIEILDVSAGEMMELLRFLYPQFRCTIDNQNVTILFILAHRFEIDFVAAACRAFILLYLSKQAFVAGDSELVKQDDGTCTTVSSILEILCVWFREFVYVNDVTACEAVLEKFAQCSVSSMAASNGFKNLEENTKWKILQARAKRLEKRRPTVC